MLTNSLQTFLSFLQAHLWLAYTTIFIIALSESLALVGLIIPGAILMFAIGTLITTGHLDFITTAIWAALGAVAGDSLSYWLGARYRQQLQNLWPLSRYPGVLDKGINFFQRHGGKSVLFGRFVGPLRPVIPAIAGMLGMSRRQFLLTNILSGLAWAPLYLLPGMAFGLSLELAGEVAGRMMIWLLALFVSLLLVIWLARHVYSFVLHHTQQWVEKLLHWSHRHPGSGQIPTALLEPLQSEKRGLAWLALLFLISVIALTLLIEFSTKLSTIRELEQLILNLPAFIHTPVADTLFSFFLSLSQPLAISLLALVITLWLLVQRQWLLMSHLLLAWLVPLSALAVLSVFGTSPIMDLKTTTPGLMLTASLLFFLGLLFGNEISPARRTTFYAALVVTLFLIFLAPLYWQHSGLIKAGIGLFIGIAWASLLGIAYRRHLVQQVTHHKYLPLLAFFVLCGWATQQPHVIKNDVAQSTIIWSQQGWQDQLWRTLPTLREDLRQSHRYPFNLQWRGSKASISRQLTAAGWHESNKFSWLTILKSLQSSPQDTDLFLLPQVHHGQYETLRWFKYADSRLFVIRLWRSHYAIDNGNALARLWFGNISIMQQHSQLGWHYLRTTKDFTQALDKLRSGNLKFIDKGNVLLLDSADNYRGPDLDFIEVMQQAMQLGDPLFRLILFEQSLLNHQGEG